MGLDASAPLGILMSEVATMCRSMLSSVYPYRWAPYSCATVGGTHSDVVSQNDAGANSTRPIMNVMQTASRERRRRKDGKPCSPILAALWTENKEDLILLESVPGTNRFQR